MKAARRYVVSSIPTACLLAFSFLSAAPAEQAQDAAPFVPAAAMPACVDAPVPLLLTAGMSVVVDTPLPMERISVGFGDIAEATAVSPRELLLNARTPGVTSLIVWEEGGTRRTFDVTVVASRILADTRVEAIRNQIEHELPGQAIDLNYENETVFLRGTVRNVTSADRAVAIASTLGKTVNLLYVDVPPPEAQILLKVKFASVDRSLGTQVGMNIASHGAANTIGGISTEQFSPPIVAAPPGSPATITVADALNLFFFRRDLNLGVTIQALQTQGLLQILAEPNVLAENGKLASFLAGGEFPFPSVSAGTGGASTVSIEFREYGIRLAFIPTITPRGTIHLQVAPEVSALDFTNGLLISGFSVPALTTRKLNTQVELNEGQSFAIGGLLDNRTTDIFEKIPFIGDIPILGKLFQSKSLKKTNTELIMIVTPELVRPIPAGQPVPAVKFPVEFLPSNSGKELRTPGLSSTGPVPDAPAHQPIPIEKLIESLRPVIAPQGALPGAGLSSPPATPPK